MVSSVQRLGAGGGESRATGAASWGPGPWRKRSSSWALRCCSWLKTPPAIAAVRMGEEAGQPFGLVAVQPGIDGVGVTPAEQAGAGDGMRRGAVGDLEQ